MSFKPIGPPCPVCGDPAAYALGWHDKTPPEGCPHDESWMKGKPRQINSVTECRHQMAMAWQAAEFRKLVPDAFDENGTIKDGRLGDVLNAFARAHPGKELVI